MKISLKSLIKKRGPWDYILYTALILVGIALDQLTKWLAVKFLAPVDTVPIIEGVIHLTYVENPGAAFGMLKDAPWVFNTLSVVAIVAILLYLYAGHAQNKLYAVSLAMIASGGIGNMIDRLSPSGLVVDFIDVRLINFAVFNVADCLVCVGAALFALDLILEAVKDYKKSHNGNEKTQENSEEENNG